jgi:hypothetical protein
MIKFQELRVGDYVISSNEGDIRRGEVTALNNNEKQVCVDNGIQEFWYYTDQLSPLPLNDEELTHLKFHKEILENGAAKYSKGAFRMIVPKADDFSHLEIWYRDEKRHILQSIPLHTFQNHFYEMTKMHLNEAVFD